jgi:type I restriction enzyme S subunit
MSFPRYPKYKASGVEWLGEVPEHWEMRRLKSACRFFGGGTPSRENPAYWNGAIPWVSPKDMKSEFIGSTEESISSAGIEASAATLLEVGHALLVVRSGILQHTIPVAINTVAVAVNQDIRALRFDKELCDPRFFLRWVQGLNDRLLLEWSKQGATVESIEHVLLANSPICLPPLAEQRAIAAFLDRETKKIDELVAEQERLIELLKEKRQAVISHAVTKGLDPAAPMKTSGVEWLGDVPAHWEVCALRRITLSMCDGPFGSGLKSEHYSEHGVRVVRLQNIKPMRFDATDAAYIEHAYCERELGDHYVIAEDVLVAGLGDENNIVGRACIAPDSMGLALVKADCFRFRLDSELAIPSFIAAALTTSSPFAAGTLATGSTRSRISLSETATRLIPLPPLAEQCAIAAFLDRETEKIDKLVAQAESAISLLTERRSALISAAVTGQIDVRNAVPEVSA